jgi:hypothetical protein
MEVGTGRNIYKAFHWPGFASGDRYDERGVMSLMRGKAFEIRGLEPPPPAVPAAPRLLPIHSADAISWQGSAGAAAYDVWRANEPAGLWTRIAVSVSDADVQYRPLFHDTTALPGQSYWYRVVARNSRGTSEPSNTVGPVAVDCRTLVDECADLNLVHTTAGGVSLSTENARAVQEDGHRFALQPGASVVYRVEGPISNWRVYAFARDGDAALDLSVSADGEHYKTLEFERAAFPSGQSVYGYLMPVLLQGRAAGDPASYLRIALSDALDGGSVLSPAGDHGPSPPAAPIELSRVEIRYDQVDQQ